MVNQAEVSREIGTVRWHVNVQGTPIALGHQHQSAAVQHQVIATQAPRQGIAEGAQPQAAGAERIAGIDKEYRRHPVIADAVLLEKAQRGGGS